MPDTSSSKSNSFPPTLGSADSAKPDMKAFMRMMDVGSELRKQREIAGEQFEMEETREDLRERLRATAEVTGEELSDAEIELAINSYFSGLYRFKEPEKDFSYRLASLYVARKKIFKICIVPILLTAFVASGVWSVGQLFEARSLAKAEKFRVDFTAYEPKLQSMYRSVKSLALEDRVKNEVKRLELEAESLIISGKAAGERDINLARKSRDGLDSIVGKLQDMQARLMDEYKIFIVSRPGVKSGIDRKFRNGTYTYYLIVEARDSTGKILSKNIRNVESAKTHSVKIWGERVPLDIYEAVRADKADNGFVDKNLFALKNKGYLNEDIVFPGAEKGERNQITSW